MIDNDIRYRLILPFSQANGWLVVFVLVVVIDLAMLLVDLYIRQMGWDTITDHSRRFWPLGASLVVWQVLGALSLALHFWV